MVANKTEKLKLQSRIRQMRKHLDSEGKPFKALVLDVLDFLLEVS